VPAEIAGQVTCCSGGRVAVWCGDGTVGFLERGFRLSIGFQAYASSILFLQQLKVHTGINSSGTAEFFRRLVVRAPYNLILYN
jgi:hypothetical protein